MKIGTGPWLVVKLVQKKFVKNIENTIFKIVIEKKVDKFSDFPPIFFPKFWNFHFSNWLFEEKNSKKNDLEKYFSRFFFSKKNRKILKWRFGFGKIRDKKCLLKNQSVERPCVARDNCFLKVLVQTSKHKKKLDQKIIPPSRSIHPKATPMSKNDRKLFKIFRLTRSFHWKSKSLIFYQTFRFSMETPSKSDILKEFCKIFGHRRCVWVNWSPSWNVFFDPGFFVLQGIHQ